jgi:hypothetical protein
MPSSAAQVPFLVEERGTEFYTIAKGKNKRNVRLFESFLGTKLSNRRTFKSAFIKPS